MSEEQNRFSLRKLSVGLASVLIGVSIFGTSQTVKADTVANNQTSSVTNNAQSSDTQKNENAVKSSFSNDNQANNAKSNLIQTQVEGKKDQKQDSVPKTQEANNSNDLDAEKDIVRTSSLQEPDNQSNNHAEDNSQTQNEQKLDLTKNSLKLAKKVLATNLIENQNNDDWADPAKHGFHYTNAGWTKLQQGKGYTSVAKTSHTTILDIGNGEELGKNHSIDIDQWSSFGTEISATVDKNDIKQGNRILISSTAVIFKDDRSIQYDTLPFNINIISNGVKIGHIGAQTDSFGQSSSEISYFLVVDQTQNVTKDLDLHIKVGHSSDFNPWGTKYRWLKGTTVNNPVNNKLVVNDSTTYNYTWYANPNNKIMPHSSYDSTAFGLNNQDLSSGFVGIWEIQHNTNKSFTTTDVTINRVIKLSRPKSVNGIVISNFKSQDFRPHFLIREIYPELAENGVLADVWREIPYTFTGVKMADGASAQQVAESAKSNHFSYSISNDGQSVLLGINIPLGRERLNKLTGTSYSTDDAINNFKYVVYDNRTLTLDYPDQANEIINRSVNWIKNHNGEPYKYNMVFSDIPADVTQPIVQTVSDVTPNVTHAPSHTDTYTPKNSDIHFDVSVYKQLNVKFIDDDDNEKVINNDTFNTSTGTDLTYNIKDATDKTFNSATDIAFPKNFVLASTQPTTVHYGVIQNTNPDIVIHVKHLVKVVSGDTDLDLYPNIKKALNSDARRTITFHYPANSQGNNPSQIVQSVHFIRSGKADFTTDTVDTSTLTQWNVVVSTAQGVIIKDGKAHFAPLTIKDLPHINGYKAHVVRSKVNPAVYMVSFMAVPSAVKPSLPNEEKPSTPTKQPETPVTPVIPDNPNWDKLDHKVVDVLNQSDSGWTMPDSQPATYTVEVPADDVIDLSDLVIAEPIHAQTTTQIRVTKRFKLSKKHSIKHLKHRKKAVRTFKKYRL